MSVRELVLRVRNGVDRKTLFKLAVPLAVFAVVALAFVLLVRPGASMPVKVVIGTGFYKKCVDVEANPMIYAQIYEDLSTEIRYKFDLPVEACNPATGGQVLLTPDNEVLGVEASFSSGEVVMLALRVLDVGIVVVNERQLSVALPVQ